MPRGKLILICQSGGEFVTNDNGCMSYDGGEAHALDINRDSQFNDLKLKLAEMCNFEFGSVSLKYFLPGNKRTLITISNDKDLKRMYDFYEDAITTDIFVLGREGFNPRAFQTPPSRSPGIKSAQTVNTKVASRVPAATSAAGLTTVPINVAPDVPHSALVTRRLPVSSPDSVIAVNAAVSFTPDDTVADDETARSPIMLDMNASPADTVKKRRRSVSRKVASNGHTAASGGENASRKKKSVGRKNALNHDLASTINDMEVQLEQPDDEPWLDASDRPLIDINSGDVSLEELLAYWKTGITGEGQEFESVAELRDVLQKYAIAHRFGYKLKKNDTSRLSAVCSVEGCSWKLFASWVPSEEVLRIKTMNKSHTCGGESWKDAHPAKSWLVSVIKERLKDNPYRKPREITRVIFEDFGIRLNYSQVLRGMEEARVQLQGSHKEAYNQLPWFCDKLVEANPRSFVKLLIDDDSKFHGLFLCFHASIHGFQNGCRPLLFLDSTVLQSKFHEILLTATALDGDDGFFPVAFAIVDIETDDNWRWFLDQLKSAISISGSITFVSDKRKGLMESVLAVFENAHHGFSLYHLQEDLRTNLKGPFHGDGKGALHVNFLAAAHAVRLDAFRLYTETIKQISTKAYDWLMEIDPNYWANAYFKGELYNQVTVDVALTYANWVEEVRELPIPQKIEAVRCKMAELITTRQMASNEWNSRLTPSKERKLLEETLKARDLRVFFSSDTVFEVHAECNYVVDVEKRDCTCMGWKVNGIPCCHAIAAFNRIGKKAYDYCSKYFTVDSYSITYSKSINPVLDTFKPLDEEEGTEAKRILPPTTPRPPVPQKEKRKKELKRVMTCSKCKGEGHNKVGCKETFE